MPEINLRRVYAVLGMDHGDPFPPPDKQFKDAIVAIYELPIGPLVLVRTSDESIYAFAQTRRTLTSGEHEYAEELDPPEKIEFRDTEANIIVGYTMSGNPGRVIVNTVIFDSDWNRVASEMREHKYTSNYRAILIGSMVGIRMLPDTVERLKLHIPHKLLIGRLNDNLVEWATQSWKTQNKQPAASLDLYVLMASLLQNRDYEFILLDPAVRSEVEDETKTRLIESIVGDSE